MDIQELIDDINSKLVKETAALDAQTNLVNELGRKYSEQMAILKIIRQNVRNLNNNISELKKFHAPEKEATIIEDSDDENDDEPFRELMTVLNEAVGIGIERGIIVDSVMTGDGIKMSVRRSIVNRAKNGIIRSCSGYYSYVEWLKNMTDEDILKLRNVGKKTGEIIRIAKEILERKE